MKLRLAVGVLWMLILLTSTFTGFAEEQHRKTKRPNVVVMLSDDQGWGDFGFQGNRNFQTPNLDHLCNTGALFNRFYVCPVCAPTRAEYLTGRYHPRGSTVGVTQGDERLDLDEITIADRFLSAGYKTAAFGKWHNGSQYPYHPNGRGFEEFYGFCSGHWGDYFSPPLEKNGTPITGNGYVTNDFMQHALEFIRHHRHENFFCYIAFNTPHTPMQVPDEFMDKVRSRELPMRHNDRLNEPEELEMTRAAIAMVENIDENVGRLLETLKELNLSEDTIVVYFNDNGPNSFRWNAGMKGRKGSLDEGGIRSPLLVRWPREIAPGKRIEQLCGAIDLVPTLCDLVGIPIEPDPDHRLDGINLANHLKSPNEPTHSRPLFSHWGGRIAMREGAYLLDAEGKLFDVLNDLGQHSDLSEQLPQQTESMKEAVNRWREDVLKSAKPRRPFLIGHQSRPKSLLPAQDGKCSGPSVVRSNTAPNCSYFTKLKTPEDRCRWEVEILHEGTYTVRLQMTVPTDALGKSIQVKIGDKRCEGVLSESFISEPYGSSNDRVTRKTESLMKRFASIQIGTITLEPGIGDLEVALVEPLENSAGVEWQGVELQGVELHGVELQKPSSPPKDIP